MKKKFFIILTSLALTLCVLTACGGNPPPSVPADEQTPPPVNDIVPGEEEPPEDEAPAEPAPAELDADGPDTAGKEEESAETSAPVSEPAPTEPVPQPEPDPDPEPEPVAEAVAEPAPAPESEPEGERGMAGNTYTISVTLEGGTGRATVESPAKLRYDEEGKCWATIVWSSPNFDYMKVDGQRYDQINTEGNSAFEIPVSAFDQPLAVIADTIAMSEPHEVEYTLTFDSASMQDA